MIELRSKCHGAQLEVHKGNIPGIESYYSCLDCGCMCEIALINDEFDVEEEGRELFSWSASPRTIGECVSYIQDLIHKLTGGINMSDIELGDKVRDIVSGLIGIAVSEINYLSGCHQYGVQSEYKDGKMPSAEYVDAGQLVIVKKHAALIQVEEDPGGAQSYAPRSK